MMQPRVENAMTALHQKHSRSRTRSVGHNGRPAEVRPSTNNRSAEVLFALASLTYPAAFDCGVAPEDFSDHGARLFYETCRALHVASEAITPERVLAKICEEDSIASRAAITIIREYEADWCPLSSYREWSDSIKLTADERRARWVIEEVAERRKAGESAAAILADLTAMAARLRPMQSQLVMVNAATIAPVEIQWFWEGRVPMGNLTMISGDPDEGKSLITIDFAARTSRGAKWPDGRGHAPFGGVVMLGAEDGWAGTVIPRLEAAGADRSRINLIEGKRGASNNAGDVADVDLCHDLALIEEAARKTPECKLATIDPIGAYMGEADSHNDAEVRRVLKPLQKMAERLGIAVVAVSHNNKSIDGNAKRRVTGSLAFVAAPRAVFAVGCDPEDEQKRRRLFLPVKANLTADKGGMSYEIDTRELGAKNRPLIVWGESTNATADAAFGIHKPKGPPPEERQRAEEFLNVALESGPRRIKEVSEEAKQVHGISAKTLYRARETIGIKPYQQGREWWLALPEGHTPF
jgi:hypothetical protein